MSWLLHPTIDQAIFIVSAGWFLLMGVALFVERHRYHQAREDHFDGLRKASIMESAAEQEVEKFRKLQREAMAHLQQCALIAAQLAEARKGNGNGSRGQ